MHTYHKKIITTLAISLFLFKSLLAGTYSGGSGTAFSPYRISDLDDLQELTETSADWDKYFRQTANINASATSTWDGGNGFPGINNFTGVYDGYNFTISQLTGKPFIIQADGFTVKNLSLTNMNISKGRGGLFYDANNGTIENCLTSGSLAYDWAYNGGLAAMGDNLIIRNSCSSCNISGVSGRDDIGGLVGKLDNSTIENCYFNGSITGAKNYVGGLVGASNNNIVKNSYSSGTITASGIGVGGVIGRSPLVNDDVTNTFWNVDTDGIDGTSSGSDNYGAKGKTTIELKDYNTYTDINTTGLSTAWDFIGTINDDSATNDYWGINYDGQNGGYPFLTWQNYDNVLPPVYWTGATDSDWSKGSNWQGNSVPTETNNVSIHDVTNNPVISTDGAVCKSITIENGGSLTINTEKQLELNGNMTLDLGSTITNNGTLKFSGTASVLNDNRDPKSSLGNILVDD